MDDHNPVAFEFVGGRLFHRPFIAPPKELSIFVLVGEGVIVVGANIADSTIETLASDQFNDVEFFASNAVTCPRVLVARKRFKFRFRRFTPVWADAECYKGAKIYSVANVNASELFKDSIND